MLHCRYYDPLNRISVENKQHLLSRHLASCLVTVLKGYYENSREIGISETNLLIEGLVDETIPA